MMHVQCVFCQLPRERIVAENDSAILIADAFPVSTGHSLVIPKRHMASFFDATTAERAAMLEILDMARATVLRGHRPDDQQLL